MMNPWKGLSSYEEADDSIYKFKGRTKAANELYQLISNNLFCTLYGKMGCGKTSLLQAGIFPLFRLQSFLPVVIRLKESDGSLADSMIKSLETECKNREVSIDLNPKWGQRTGGQIGEDYKLWEFLYSHEFHDNEGNVVAPVIAIDQIEEAFNEQYEKACELLKQLYYLVSDDLRLPKECNANFRVVVTIREDDLYLLEDAIGDGRYGVLKQNRYRLEPLTDEEAREVIALGEQFFEKGEEKAITEKILALSKEGSAHVSTYMLSLVCSQLFISTNGHIALKDVQDSSTGLLQSFYEDSIKHVNKDTKDYIETKLISGDRKSFIPLDVFKQEVDPADVKTLMEGEYKMVQEIKAGTTPCVELLHDSLAKAIRKYKDEEEERKRQEKERQKLLERQEREKQELVRLQEEELARIAEEEQLAKAERFRKLLYTGIAVLGLVLGLLALSVWYKIKKDQEETARVEAEDARKRAEEELGNLDVNVTFDETAVHNLWWVGELKVLAVSGDSVQQIGKSFRVTKESLNHVSIGKEQGDKKLLFVISYPQDERRFQPDTIPTSRSQLIASRNQVRLTVKLASPYEYEGKIVMSDSLVRPVENALVVIGNEVAYTDAHGEFLFQLAEPVSDDTDVLIFKRGYTIKNNLMASSFDSAGVKKWDKTYSLELENRENYLKKKKDCERIDSFRNSILNIPDTISFVPYGIKGITTIPINYAGLRSKTGNICFIWRFVGKKNSRTLVKGYYWYDDDMSPYRYHFIESGFSLEPLLDPTDSLYYRSFDLRSMDVAGNDEIIKGRYCTSNGHKRWEFNIFVQSNKIAESVAK